MRLSDVLIWTRRMWTGLIFVNTADQELMSGAIVRVEITGAMEYDLIGSLVED